MSLKPYFNLSEAQPLVAICAQIESATIGNPPDKDPEVIPLGTPIIPSNWKVVHKPSKSIAPFDGYYEIWQNTAATDRVQLALAFRGTQLDTMSILEDLLLFMVPAQGEIDLLGGKFKYTLAEEPRAGVHAGWLLGMATMLPEVLVELAVHAGSEDCEIFITGHSQGAAIATLFSSFVKYHPADVPRASYKTYMFGQPKPGNDYYAYDFEQQIANGGYGIRVINALSWVSQAPLTLEQFSDWGQPNPITLLDARFPKAAKIHQSIAAAEKDLVDHLAGALDRIIELLGTDPHLKILPTLNYAPAGLPYVLTNQADIPARNPCDQPDADPPVIDFMWQHHASMYAKLLGVSAGLVPKCRKR